MKIEIEFYGVETEPDPDLIERTGRSASAGDAAPVL